ncbi:hypothetical protein N825_19420 [Skermanella stibiiresistens SB22]|uniref:Uncharacterized protein n=1 Tax=Skermanella stibiiresistens SB22 TaxID=1385369 RepID=W9HC97_9PROT|nr:hypothetical protein [Skermanella stibiiresistens]EWY42351.1 hypothetical protein N825_19420 [Skermanella stibiiresistens SB22]
MIKIEITLSTARLNADRAWDDQFDPVDYAHKLEGRLRPRLEHVVVRTTALGHDHNVDIILPDKAADRQDMTDMLARRIVEAVRSFHQEAPGTVSRLPPRRFQGTG